MNELHKEYGPKGLHVFTLYCQAHPLAQIEELVAKHKIEYPIALDGTWADNYPAQSLPQVWVIGVDGKIIFKGAKGYDEVIEKELAKVKYPGLGRDKVASEVEPAAKAFAKKQFAEAVKLATAVAEGDFNETAQADAQYILERVETRVRALLRHAEMAEVQKDYATCEAVLKLLAGAYKGCEDTEDAAERLKKLAQDKDAQKEIAARRALLIGMRDLDWGAGDLDLNDPKVMAEFRKKCIAFFDKLVKDHAGTAAAETAKGYADYHREQLKAEGK
ncbi:MAG: hypothetical protein HS108_13530 [Planctomycetes bacterium]|jgi:hypothetical protein|nr:hypothetical protein [Planctomycetota bacterium]MCL4730770.1 hypothetical protein [Planctomycetota bacterium]